MLRMLGEFASLIFFFLLIRSVVTMVWRMFRGLSSIPNPAYRPTPPEKASADMRTSGELRKDPVCGTFVATSSVYTRVANGDTLYFCSKECRDKFAPARTSWGKSTAARS